MCKGQSLLEEHMVLESTGGEPAGFDSSDFFLPGIDGALHADSSRGVAVQAEEQLFAFPLMPISSVSTSEAGKSLCLYWGYLASAGNMLPKQLALPALFLCFILYYLVSS